MENLEAFKLRALRANNDRQHDRMVRDKLRSLHRALLYSYQAAWIKKDEEGSTWCRALINPDKVKFDYDEKIVSTDFENGFAAGDSFEWPEYSGQHWLILKQELTEVAYFRANVRRCQLVESIDPETGEKLSLWCAVRGPVETKINTIQKAGIVADVPNLTLDIYMKCNESTIRTFDRYRKFSFMGKTWKVTAPDWISTPGILEISAQEDYECDSDDLIVETVDPNPTAKETEPQIIGSTFTKPLNTEIYKLQPEDSSAKWSVSLVAQKNKEIDDVLDYKVNADNSFTAKWTAMVSGSYIIKCGDAQKTVVVESLF